MNPDELARIAAAQQAERSYPSLIVWTVATLFSIGTWVLLALFLVFLVVAW